MKKGDFVIIFSVLIAAGLITVLFLFGGTNGNNVIIKQNEKTINTVPLSQNTVIKLESNTIRIKDGKVEVVWASCKNQICRKHTPISKKGESIVCLPNEVIITIEN